MEINYPIIQQVDSDEYKLIKDFKYIHRSQYEILISSGFIFDGASIPKFAWSIVGSPFTGKYTIGALIHDALYKTHLLSRKESDNIFYEIMQDCGVGYLKRNTFYYLLRMCGNSAYNSYTENLTILNKQFVELY